MYKVQVNSCHFDQKNIKKKHLQNHFDQKIIKKKHLQNHKNPQDLAKPLKLSCWLL